MLESTISITGEVDLNLYGPDGVLKQHEHVNNLVVDTGLDMIAERMKNTPTITEVTHMEVGTSGTAPGAGDTDLIAAHGDARLALDSTGVAGAVATYINTWAAGASTGSLQEAGMFNHLTAGDLIARATFSTITKGAGDSLVITWTITIS